MPEYLLMKSGQRVGKISWNPAMATFQMDLQTYRFGTTYREWSDPTRLLGFARRVYATPEGAMDWTLLASFLIADRDANPPSPLPPPDLILAASKPRMEAPDYRQARQALERTEKLTNRIRSFVTRTLTNGVTRSFAEARCRQ